MKTTISFLLNFLLLLSAYAQNAPMKWGKVSKEELAMTVYDPDPDAGAVVLGDVGYVSLEITNGDVTYKLEHHKRIKILNQTGYDKGDISISFYTPDRYEVIKGLKAQVILPNGDILDVKDVFEEKINDYYSAKKFAFPNLTPGCIIEYKYTKSSKGFYNLEPWYFQGDIPVKLSQLTTEIPEWYRYVSFAQGRKATVDETSRNTPIMINNTGKYDKVNGELITTKYTMVDVPALKVEPYITTMLDYYSKIQFQLQSIQYPNSPLYDMENTWGKLEKELISHLNFGDQITKDRYSKKMWAALEPILQNAQNEEEKLSMIYRFVSSNLVWDETYSFLIEKTLDDAFENKSANSGELNLLMVALCKQAGINAYPVLISTRSHGRMLPYYPKIDQFNHVLAYAHIGEKEFIFDVGNTLHSPDLLPENSLNSMGWLVQANSSEWIQINAPADQEVCMANFDLLPSGNLVGSIGQSYTGYGAIEERIAYHNDRENKKIKETWSNKFADIKIDSIVFENEKELTKPFQSIVYCTIPEAVQSSGDFMYISPVVDPYSENPFKHEKREFAIDMPYGFKNQYILNLTIPEGYVVDELPEAVNLSLPNNGGKFQFFISQKENTIQLVNKISISQLHYEPEEYAAIRNFFDIIVKKHSEQIVLKKAT